MKNIGTLLGKVITEIDAAAGNDEISMHCTDGSHYKMLHYQDCCESVSIEDISGDIADLIGHPILQAEASESEECAESVNQNNESATWTFYKLSTIKGSVTIRWFGSSNGYYSERVDFVEVASEKENY